jgi:hypothetical protein
MAEELLAALELEVVDHIDEQKDARAPLGGDVVSTTCRHGRAPASLRWKKAVRTRSFATLADASRRDYESQP